MNKGNYFELDKESISIDNRMVVFNYLRYKNKNTCSSNERVQPEYPIYSVFTKEGVRFYIHTCEQIIKNKVTHYSGCILFLPISLDKDFHNELTTILNTSCNSRIPIKKEIIITNTDIKEFGSDIELFKSDKNEKNNNPTDESISIGQLILDFMFDMEHSSVFKNSVLYNDIYSCLHEHYLYDAINTKTEYIFYKNICDKDNSDIFAQDMFSRIERRWVEIITNPKSEYLFHESLWFKDVIDEMNSIYESDKSCLDLCEKIKKSKDTEKIKNKVKVTSEISRDWYMSKYRPDGVLRIRYGEYFSCVLWGICIPIVLLALFFVFYPHFMKTISDTTKGLILVCLLIFPILQYMIPKLCVKRHLFRFKSIPVIIFPRLWAGICAGWMTVGLSDIVLDSYVKYSFGASLVIFIVVLSFVMLSVNNILTFSKKRTLIIISLFLTSVSLIYSVSSGYILFKLYEGKLVDCFDPIHCVCDAKTLLLFSSLSMFVGVFINMLSHNKSISAYE